MPCISWAYRTWRMRSQLHSWPPTFTNCACDASCAPLAVRTSLRHPVAPTMPLVVNRQVQCRWVHFTGPKGELPKGDDGSYGTHMTLAHAMDPGSDVLIAYKQNGQFLHPDHGFPCRMLIPGWIGGRMVKWLSHIHVSSEESTNWCAAALRCWSAFP